MPTPTNIHSELDRHRAYNASRAEKLMEQEEESKAPRGFVLCFSASNESDGTGLARLLFAKGLHPLTPAPELQSDGTWQLRFSVQRTPREITQEDFLCDLITLASGVHATYDRWDFLGDEASSSEKSVPSMQS